MFIFSFSLTFGNYYTSTLFNPNNQFSNWQLSQIQSMASSWSAISNLNNGQDVNPALIFGDFFIALTVLGKLFLSVIAGTSITLVIQGLPGVDNTILLLYQIIYGSSQVLLWVYVASNRSL